MTVPSRTWLVCSTLLFACTLLGVASAETMLASLQKYVRSKVQGGNPEKDIVCESLGEDPENMHCFSEDGLPKCYDSGGRKTRVSAALELRQLANHLVQMCGTVDNGKMAPGFNLEMITNERLCRRARAQCMCPRDIYNQRGKWRSRRFPPPDEKYCETKKTSWRRARSPCTWKAALLNIEKQAREMERLVTLCPRPCDCWLSKPPPLDANTKLRTWSKHGATWSDMHRVLQEWLVPEEMIQQYEMATMFDKSRFIDFHFFVQSDIKQAKYEFAMGSARRLNGVVEIGYLYVKAQSGLTPRFRCGYASAKKGGSAWCHDTGIMPDQIERVKRALKFFAFDSIKFTAKNMWDMDGEDNVDAYEMNDVLPSVSNDEESIFEDMSTDGEELMNEARGYGGNPLIFMPKRKKLPHFARIACGHAHKSAFYRPNKWSIASENLCPFDFDHQALKEGDPMMSAHMGYYDPN